ncbi:MAG: L,D-transpeptidase family protein [Woeseiaceae bacterium]|nr:L,D-transpeptidase family protein [Woeseiaceae bacterium]
MNRGIKLFAALFAVVVFMRPALAEIYDLPPDGYDVIGAVSTTIARHEDSLVEIARRHGLGYHDIVKANPDVDVWLPGEGTRIVLPTRFVLPPGPREGLVLNLAEYRMYYYPETAPGETPVVMTYPMSIGRQDWETPLGVARITAKAVNPTWYPPKSVREEHAAEGRPLPNIVPPGPDNPLGAFAMRLSLPGYLIHSTNRPAGVGMRVTHGCIRMFPEDIEFLFSKVDLKTKVRIINEPIKLGWSGDELVIEVHPVLESPAEVDDEPAEEPNDSAADETAVAEAEVELPGAPKDPLTFVTEQFIAATSERAGRLDWDEVERLVERADGIPAAAGIAAPAAAPSVASE